VSDKTAPVESSTEVVARHLTLAFVNAFGTSEFEVWLGKDGVSTHTAAEVGLALAASLSPLLEDSRVVALVDELHNTGQLGKSPVDPGPP
jgi:hypothetical protein